MADINRLITKSIFAATEKYYRNGIELEKGVLLNDDRINENSELYEYYATIFSVYPDIFLDIIGL